MLSSNEEMMIDDRKRRNIILATIALLLLIFIAVQYHVKYSETEKEREFDDFEREMQLTASTFDLKQLEKDKSEGAKKIKEHPECASTRRLEHPGLWSTGPRIQYIHMPKAGGTSIQLALSNWAKTKAGAQYMKYDSNSVSGTSFKCPGDAYRATILAGHRGFGFCQGIEESSHGLFVFTAIRETASRMVSWYYYNLNIIHEDRANAVFGTLGLTLPEIVKKFDATPKIEYGESLLRYSGSQQARFLCGYRCMGPSAEGRNLTEEYILEKALENLRKVDVVGITDRLDDMIVQLKFHLPKLVPKDFFHWKRDNVHGTKVAIDDETKAILKKWGWVDEELYKEAKKIFEKKHHIASRCLELFNENFLPEPDASQDGEN